MSKTSTFMICINTNKVISKISKEKVHKLVEGTKYLVSNFNSIKNNYYVDKELKPLTKNEFNKIEKIQSDYNIEIGEKYNRFHFNIFVNINHNTYLKMNRVAIKNFYEKILEDKVSIKISATGNNIQKLKEYSLKNKTSIKKLFEYKNNEENKTLKLN
jgi:hypothetical protein